MHLEGLRNPKHFLAEEPGNVQESSIIHQSLPDTTIMYRLLQECGRVVDTHAWYLAFQSILQTPKRSCRDSYNNTILSRFTLGLSQLEMAGLVGPLKRSRDFYERKYIFDSPILSDHHQDPEDVPITSRGADDDDGQLAAAFGCDFDDGEMMRSSSK